VLRSGNAGSNTAADHVTVLNQVITQGSRPGAAWPSDPGPHRRRRFVESVLRAYPVVADSGVHAEFSIGWSVTDREHTAIAALPESAWTAAVDTAGDLREGAAVAELTALLPARVLVDYPAGTRVIVRRAVSRSGDRPGEHRFGRPSSAARRDRGSLSWSSPGVVVIHRTGHRPVEPEHGVLPPREVKRSSVERFSKEPRIRRCGPRRRTPQHPRLP
jgi:hypothetical protein